MEQKTTLSLTYILLIGATLLFYYIILFLHTFFLEVCKTKHHIFINNSLINYFKKHPDPESVCPGTKVGTIFSFVKFTTLRVAPESNFEPQILFHTFYFLDR